MQTRPNIHNIISKDIKLSVLGLSVQREESQLFDQPRSGVPNSMQDDMKCAKGNTMILMPSVIIMIMFSSF